VSVVAAAVIVVVFFIQFGRKRVLDSHLANAKMEISNPLPKNKKKTKKNLIN